jgi:hypothetical protein
MEYIVGLKKNFGALIFLLVGAALIGASVENLIKDLNVDLTKSAKYFGEVVYSGIHQIRADGIPGKYSQPAFLIKVKGYENFFGVYRSYHGYQDLSLAINTGDSILMYFRPSNNKYNLRVYQIEKNGKIVIDYSEYNERVSKYAGLCFFIGIVMSIAAIMWYKNINLVRFLDGLVKP